MTAPTRDPNDDPSNERHLTLEPWTGTYDASDPNANFKNDVTLYSHVDPLVTLRGLSQATDLPVGTLAHYVLARYATTGSSGLLEMGPDMIHRLWEPIERAEESDDDHDRLIAYRQLRDILSWLRGPLVDPVLAETAYETGGSPQERETN